MKVLFTEGVPFRDGFDDPGLILASQYGAGVYLMTVMQDDEWTSRIVFAEHCNPNADDFLDEIAAAAYGTEETAELIPLVKLERNLAVAKRNGQMHLTVSRTAAVSR